MITLQEAAELAAAHRIEDEAVVIRRPLADLPTMAGAKGVIGLLEMRGSGVDGRCTLWYTAQSGEIVVIGAAGEYGNAVHLISAAGGEAQVDLLFVDGPHEGHDLCREDEIQSLKDDWLSDPHWDIEATPEFEAHRDELLAFREATETSWKADRDGEWERDVANVMLQLRDLEPRAVAERFLSLENRIAAIDRRLSELEGA